jgi:signal transduction histidine kinase
MVLTKIKTRWLKMKTPSFMKTIRFRLTIWYSAFLVLIMAVLVIGINIAIINSRPVISAIMPPFPGDNQTFRQGITDERNRNMQDLRNFSLIGVGVVLIFGAIGGYYLSGFMLKPVDRVSSLASRISHTNLKERIKYMGPADEVKRLADTFDNMLERLDSAFESQKQFIQDASHELRTPIAIAQTNIEVLEMEKRATREDYKRLVDILKMSINRMKDINNSLLLLSEESLLKSRRAMVNIGLLLREVYIEAGAEAKATGINFELKPTDSNLFVSGDTIHLKQVLINLIDNAIKYNRPDGTIVLSAHQDSQLVIIEVSDTGIGISPEDLPRVFDRFFRVDKSRSRVNGGSGLGLAIVKRIIEDHGGTVSVESTVGIGSTFRISLPMSNKMVTPA